MVTARLTATLILIVSLLGTSAFAQDRQRRDGNWWVSLPIVSSADEPTNLLIKLWYLTGIMDGAIAVGHQLAIATAVEARDQTAGEKIEADYWRATDRYLSRVTQTQLGEGLDSFYRDFRNRSILVSVAVTVVLRQIAGADDSEIEQTIEALRRRASDGSLEIDRTIERPR